MDMKFTPFLQRVDSTIKDSTQRAAILAAVIGIAAAQELSLPSSKADDAEGYYNGILMPEYNAILDRFNENLVFSVKEALVMTRAFWMLRYETLYPCNEMPNSQYGFFDTLVGAHCYFSPDQHKFLNDNKDVIFQLTFYARRLIETFSEG